MVMRLRPPELGDVTVRVAVTGRDVAAWFASPQPQVQNAISAALGQLQTSLGDAGYNLSGAWVGGGAANAQQEQSDPPGSAASRTLSAVAVPSPAAAQLPAASGLNIYV
jgi:flagellar hook-length control protein FliK